MSEFTNPFRPGAGQPPPHLAGRTEETEEFRRLLTQKVILENLVLTGLRGVGKTVLLDTFKPIAVNAGWLWVGADLSESASVSEETIAIRLCTDLAVVTSQISIGDADTQRSAGFISEATPVQRKLDYKTLSKIYSNTPGLVSDKVKNILETAWRAVSDVYNSSSPPTPIRGIIFAYDEAQNLSDQAAKEQYPLSLILDVFQSIQRKGLPLMLVLTGLPTLFPKLVEARTYSERMFHVLFLDRLNEDESKEAIVRPIAKNDCPVKLSERSVDTIVDLSGGYPYFIQFICKEVYDAFLHKSNSGEDLSVPVEEIRNKLDNDFFAGRWSRATDRQRALLGVIARLPNSDTEFTIQEIVDQSKVHLSKPFKTSHVNQMLVALSTQGLVFKNRHGKYSFAVPLMGRYIERETEIDFILDGPI